MLLINKRAKVVEDDRANGSSAYGKVAGFAKQLFDRLKCCRAQ
jgi:hypothetical protein